ncbi:MAG TPA: BREX-1 system phosphatase PglZ type A [Candidatus Cloacimonetes bacterium]|nr:BREX-1 system phosphatase PglZ type A [Candidatus Cloacimonadota bacterium]
MKKIENIIKKHFEEKRIVFWYDSDAGYRIDIETIDLPGVSLIIVENNEFAIKYRVLIEEPKTKFLIYSPFAKPELHENWLADLLLSNAEVSIDKASLVLMDMGWDRSYLDLVKEYYYFFNSAQRISALRKIHDGTQSFEKTKWMMLAVFCKSDSAWEDVVISLLVELARGSDEKYKLIRNSGMGDWFWEQMQNLLGYSAEDPGIKDLAYKLFESAYNIEVEMEHTLNHNAIYLLNRFKNDVRYLDDFRSWSDICGDWLNISDDLALRDIDDLLEIDYFEDIERKILSDMVRALDEMTMDFLDIDAVRRKRESSYWYKDYSHEYHVIVYGAYIRYMLNTVDLSMDSFDDGLQGYMTLYYGIDYAYRKFIFNYQKARHHTLLKKLYDDIENRYMNGYLFPLSINFSEKIRGISEYKSGIMPRQSAFWQREIAQYPQSGKRIFVIISDGLRYEAAHELVSMIRQEDRYEAKLEAQLGMLPSYTQLGMAALLPNRELSIYEDGSVMVDGVSSQGSENRCKILEDETHGKALVLKAAEVLAMGSIESRNLYRDYDVVYVYHNKIDAIGDNLTSEGEVFEAVDHAQKEIIELLRKLTAGNANNIIITADHGFLYQHQALAESDFLSESDFEGEQYYKQRRFVLGKNLKSSKPMMHFTAAELGLSGEIEAMIPPGNQRMRKQGSGSRYVHGGASLQEIVVPIIHVNKKRESDVSFVDVDILTASGRVISTGQMVVKLFQREPVSDKMQGITLIAGIYTQSGELISDEKKMVFDFDSENAWEREQLCSLVLSANADDANNQDVIFKLQKPIAGTNQYQIYKSETYVLRRAFSSDFDI